MCLHCSNFGFRLKLSLPSILIFLNVGALAEDDWPTCDNREFRDDETEPGGLKLLGVKESPLGFFPQTPAALTHEHFFQQLREVLTDDCPRIFVEVGLQPAPGLMQNWSSTSLWLRYFNHSGIVLAMDPVIDFLEHHSDSLKKEPWSSILGRSLKVKHVHASLGQKDAEDQALSGDGNSQVKLFCESGPGVDSPSHPCYRVRRRSAWPAVEYRAATLTFDTVWQQDLGGRHIDFLDVGNNNFAQVLEGFEKVFSARAFTVVAFRVGTSWTKKDLEKVVAYLDKFEYFSMFRLVCDRTDSQLGAFSYHGPGGANNGPTTYLPLSSMDLFSVIDWEKMPLPQDVISLDLRQPEVFKTVQLGDVQCNAEESGACAADDDQCGASISKPPQRPQLVRVTKSGSRSITLEWRPHPEGPSPDSYLLRVEPGALEETVDHDTFDALSSVQSHTINGLRPDVEYVISLRALGIGGESSKVTLSHRTGREEVPLDSPYEIMEGMHCGMGAAEEVQPAGPSPSGASYFPGLGDVESCRSRCEGNRQCVTFQVNAGNACWLYRRKPERQISGPRSDPGWWCAVRKE